MNKEQYDEWFSELEKWQWDGASVRDVLSRYQDLTRCGLLCSWKHTIPEQYRGLAYFVDSYSPVNSIQEIRRCIEILAVDKEGQALVFECTTDSYLDVDYNEVQRVIPLTEAQALIDNAEERRRQHEAGEQEPSYDWSLAGYDQTM
jgi:hypothetical protein